MSETISQTEFSADQFDGWLSRFRFYRDPPDRTAIKEWISRFIEADRNLAAKILDHVRVVSEREIHEGYRSALQSLPGWNIDPTKRNGRWYFMGFGKAGESGQAMVRLFREANNLTYAKYNNLFSTITELSNLKLTAYDTVVFIDDFSGSGRQVTTMWPVISELVASEAKCYLVLTAVTADAQEKIVEHTELEVKASMHSDDSNNVFSKGSRTFSDAERDRIE